MKTKPDIAREIAEQASHKFTDGDFEVRYDQPVTPSGDKLGLWVPCRLFVRFDDIQQALNGDRL
jgi:hypothetical protein